MRAIGVMTKRSTAGRVKTRLVPALPAALAATLHTAMVQDTLATGDASGASDRWLFLSGPGDDPAHAAAWQLREQPEGDLGTRLRAAFEPMLAPGDARAIVIGTDCPDLRPSDLDDAFARLETHEAVIGPAEDGGYYLIGLARPAPDLFRGISWGGAGVLEETLSRARALGLRIAMLERRADIDTPGDLAAWIGSASLSGPGSARATRHALTAMGLLPG
jgi:rSAM/selenodomain-associated transferase 1